MQLIEAFILISTTIFLGVTQFYHLQHSIKSYSIFKPNYNDRSQKLQTLLVEIFDGQKHSEVSKVIKKYKSISLHKLCTGKV